MKNLFPNIIMLLIGVLILNSCSSNNETETQPVDLILVKKIIKTYSPNDVVILTYRYDGNRIISESDDNGYVSNFTYTGNVITKIEERVNNVFQRSREYTYVDGKVAMLVKKTNYDGTDSYSYTYNSNGTVSYKRTRTGSVNTTGLLTISDGNIIKNERFSSIQPSSSVANLYGYDTKNNPFKNVLGFNLLLDTDEVMFSRNNMTQDGGAGDGSLYNYTFKYDASGFPTERTPAYENSNELFQYFY